MFFRRDIIAIAASETNSNLSAAGSGIGLEVATPLALAVNIRPLAFGATENRKPEASPVNVYAVFAMETACGGARN